MIEYLPWVLPPLLGATIGYVTNAIAIRMLFRPLRPVVFLGITLPFTPGVIPRQRDDLAERIGDMVARDLLTPDVFHDRFTAGSFHRTLRVEISRGIAAFAQTELATIVDYFGGTSAVRRISTVLERLLCSGGHRTDEVVAVIRDVLDRSEIDVEGIVDALLRSVRPFQIVTDDDVGRLVGAIWPNVTDTVEEALRSDSVRRTATDVVRRVLAYTLDQLSGVQRLMVTAGGYDRQLLDRAPAIASRGTAEFVAILRRESTRRSVVEHLLRWLESRRDAPLYDLLPDTVRRSTRSIVARAFRDENRSVGAIRGVLAAIDTQRLCVEGARGVEGWIIDYLDAHPTATPAELFPTLYRHRGYLGRRITRRVVPAVVANTPRFVGHLDVRRVVVDRINDLDIERVESLLLGIIRKHLRWINVFGAVLGALIGGAQLVLRVLGL